MQNFFGSSLFGGAAEKRSHQIQKLFPGVKRQAREKATQKTKAALEKKVVDLKTALEKGKKPVDELVKTAESLFRNLTSTVHLTAGFAMLDQTIAGPYASPRAAQALFQVARLAYDWADPHTGEAFPLSISFQPPEACLSEKALDERRKGPLTSDEKVLHIKYSSRAMVIRGLQDVRETAFWERFWRLYDLQLHLGTEAL